GFVDPLGRRTAVNMNAAGQITATTDGLRHMWRFAYSGGDLTSVTDPTNAVRSVFVDGAGRIIGSADPLGQTTRFTWDRLNQLTSWTDAMGGRTTLTHDG